MDRALASSADSVSPPAQGVRVLYPFEARAAEVVVVPSRSFSRAADLVKVFQSRDLTYRLERSGYEVPGRQLTFRAAEKVFAGRPTIRSDLPPPTPAELERLRALRPSAPVAGAGR